MIVFRHIQVMSDVISYDTKKSLFSSGANPKVKWFHYHCPAFIFFSPLKMNLMTASNFEIEDFHLHTKVMVKVSK